jgi:hypothetical protein
LRFISKHLFHRGAKVDVLMQSKVLGVGFKVLMDLASR